MRLEECRFTASDVDRGEFRAGRVTIRQPWLARTFKNVPIWIGVGADDVNPADVPDEWDQYIGDDRRERAERFSVALSEMGGDVKLEEFAGTSHGLTDEMRAAGCAALAEADS